MIVAGDDTLTDVPRNSGDLHVCNDPELAHLWQQVKRQLIRRQAGNPFRSRERYVQWEAAP